MAQYEKLINLGLLSQFLTKAKTIFAPKITASGILKGDGNGSVSAATAGSDYATPALVKISDTQPIETENKLWIDTDAENGNSYQVPTVAESLAMGISGAKVGDLVRVNSVDSNGKPTSWKHVPLNEIKCNKNLLDNWYFVGGGSQLGDGVFPINQRGQSVYSGVGYGIDRWQCHNSHFNVDIASSAIKVYSDDSFSGGANLISQYISNPSALLGKTITISIIINGALAYNSFQMPDELPASGTVGVGSSPSIAGMNVYLRVIYGKLSCVVYANSSYTAGTVANITAVKLELGSEQTLAHNEGTEENPVWVLNEVPDYGEELRKCKLYFERIGGTYSTIGSGTADSNNIASFLTYVSPKSSAFTGRTDKVPSANISTSGTFYINGSGIGSKNAPVTNVFVYKELTYNGIFRFQSETSASLTTGYGYTIQAKDTAAYIDISCEP